MCAVAVLAARAAADGAVSGGGGGGGGGWSRGASVRGAVRFGALFAVHDAPRDARAGGSCGAVREHYGIQVPTACFYLSSAPFTRQVYVEGMDGKFIIIYFIAFHLVGTF